MMADIVVGLQYGDCGKGKITHHLCSKTKYTHVLRFNGGCNAGHTIYHNGKKFVTHHIPCGVFYDIPSIIDFKIFNFLPNSQTSVFIKSAMGEMSTPPSPYFV